MQVSLARKNVLGKILIGLGVVGGLLGVIGLLGLLKNKKHLVYNKSVSNELAKYLNFNKPYCGQEYCPGATCYEKDEQQRCSKFNNAEECNKVCETACVSGKSMESLHMTQLPPGSYEIMSAMYHNAFYCQDQSFYQKLSKNKFIKASYQWVWVSSIVISISLVLSIIMIALFIKKQEKTVSRKDLLEL